MLKLLVLVASLSLASPSAHPQGKFQSWWTGFCERHLVAEHPYQLFLQESPISKVVQEYRHWGGIRHWTGEVTDEFQIAYAVMISRFRSQDLSLEERSLVIEAVEDYPL